MNTQASRSFRLVCGQDQVPLVEALLHSQGFTFEEEPFHPLARKLTGGSFALGSSLAAFFGYIYIQDRSSMLPPLALMPEPGAAVLDMCASPGSKTGLLGALVGSGGFILGNEPDKKRLGTLRRNIRRQNLLQCATCSWPGESLPLPDAGALYAGWSHIQLDPPCSGWGTAEKNPQVLRLWQGDKLGTLIGLQRRLLAEAARLLRPGGKLAYSTCTTNAAENEEQARYARDLLGLDPVALEHVPGFALVPPSGRDCSGVWRVAPGADGQGFFVALFRKPGLAEPAEKPHAPAFVTQDWEYLPRESLSCPGLVAERLPEGDLAVFSDTVHFLPALSRALLPRGFAWKGFPLGRMDKRGHTRADPFLHSLMPSVEQARGRGFPCLNAEEIKPILALVSGQSLAVDISGPETGLYYQSLPLCRLSVKGRRAVMPRGQS